MIIITIIVITRTASILIITRSLIKTIIIKKNHKSPFLMLLALKKR